jgi:hypothetical protein
MALEGERNPVREGEGQTMIADETVLESDGGLGTNREGKPYARSFHDVPWQIWVVVALLAIEGLGNLLIIPAIPWAITWVLWKCLFVVGLVKAWRWVFGLFLVMCAIHVLYFLMLNPVAAFENLVMIGLTCSASRYYFPASAKSAPS